MLVVLFFAGTPRGAFAANTAPMDEVPDPLVEFWVVEPNEGDSSGGHAALRLGEWIYHVEHRGDGLIADRRTPRSLFETAYRGRGNRAISAIPLALDRPQARDLETRLEARGFDRDRRLDRLDALEAQTKFLARVVTSGAIEVEVPGLGLFESEPSHCPLAADSNRPPKSAGVALERGLARHYGPRWLGERRAKAHAATAARLRELLAAPRSRSPRAQHGPLASPASTDAAGYGDLFRRLVDAAQTAEAFDLASECRRVRRDRLHVVDSIPRLASESTSSPADWQALRDALAERWVALAGSDRPDLGLPLMLARARLEALDRSIASGRLHVLDSHVESGVQAGLFEGLPEPWIPPFREAIESSARVSRERLKTGRAPLEARLADLERTEHALRHLRAGTRHRPPASLGSKRSRARRYAAATRVLPWPANALIGDFENAHSRSEGAARSLRSDLGKTLDYTLFTRNCVTELLAELALIESTEPRARSPLPLPLLSPSPSLEADRSAAKRDVLRGRFIPVVAGRAVERALASGPRRRLASAREIELRSRGTSGSGDGNGNGIVVRLRETIALTARSYRPHAGDSHFLFFARPTWLRPILGLANLGYGLGQASVGLLSAPFDRGERLRRGVMGAVMSVPELFFFRVRQGSYPAMPPGLLAVSHDPDDSGRHTKAGGQSLAVVSGDGITVSDGSSSTR